MRTTNSILINNMIGYVSTNQRRMEKYQYQMATGKKIRVPSDDPVVAARALKLRTDVSEIVQYKKNVEDAQSWLQTTEAALGNIGDILHRANELAVQGANGTLTQDDTRKIEEEAKQLREQLVHIANTTYNGRYIFSGFQTDKPLVEMVAPDAAIVGNNYKYAIDVKKTDVINYQIGIDDKLNINVLGGDLFEGEGLAASRTATPGMIGSFNDFINALHAGDLDKIKDAIGYFQNDMTTVLRVRADVGARTNRLELSGNRLDDDNVNFTGLMSKNEDIDEAEVIINLKNEENVYRASLAGGARIIQTTLLDFLK